MLRLITKSSILDFGEEDAGYIVFGGYERNIKA